MNIWILLVVIGVFAFVTFKNFKLFKRYGRNKKYIDCYNSFIVNEEGAYEKTLEMVGKEDNIEYKNKTRMFEILMELDKGINGSAVDNLDLTEVFSTDGKIDLKDKLAWNSDTFIWVIFAIAKAKKYGFNDVADKLIKKFDVFEGGLDGRIEYQLILAVNKALNGTDDKGIPFLRKLVDGDYSEYSYDKNFIGVYKRIASSTLAFLGEPLDEYYENDLHEFANMRMGKMYMDALGIYDKYYVDPDAPEDETTDNPQLEDVMTKEETTEETDKKEE